MLFKGMLLGFVLAIASVVFYALYVRWVTASLNFSGQMSVDIRPMERFLFGMTIGVGLIPIVLLAAPYALQWYALHAGK
jgi:hypothetical protein